MTLTVELLSGLPPYGPMAIPYPDGWARTGREGTVVQFESPIDKWIGNFEPGWGDLSFASLHPNERDAVVVAGGDLWIVSGESRIAEYVLPAIVSAYEVSGPEGWIFDRQGLALARLGPSGIIWHSRRLSWDGFDELCVARDVVTGLGWSAPDNSWKPFEVELATGRSSGGGFAVDDEDWEKLAVVAT